MRHVDMYSEPDAPDPVLPTGLVRELAAAHLPADVRLPGGMDVSRLDDAGRQLHPQQVEHLPLVQVGAHQLRDPQLPAVMSRCT